MIKDLKRRFTFINMSLAFLVLVIVFSALCIYQISSMNRQTHTILQNLITRQEMRPGGMYDRPSIGERPGEDRIEGIDRSFVIVELDQNGEITGVFDARATIEEDVLYDIVKTVLESEKSTGVIRSYSVKYMKDTYISGNTRIVILDVSSELEDERTLITNSLLGLVIATVAFYFISLFLSDQAVKPVEKAWEQQKQFIADASHELKTPLTVMLANSDIILSHPDDTVADQRQWVESTKEETLRMKELVEDMLFLAKSDAGREVFMMGTIDLSDILKSEALTFEAVAFEKNITMEDNIDDGLTLEASAKHMTQLIRILLDNAVKYANEGGSIRVSAHRRVDEIVLSVSDTGSFIPEKDREKIFERFYRADESRSREEGGYGLGLAMAKSIVDTHRGKITALSDSEKTTFTVVLPVKQKA